LRWQGRESCAIVSAKNAREPFPDRDDEEPTHYPTHREREIPIFAPHPVHLLPNVKVPFRDVNSGNIGLTNFSGVECDYGPIFRC
jgi:hypothetical protein